MISLFRLFIIFVKIGAILLGGGYVILPIVLHEFTEKRNLVTREDMLDFFAVSQTLPGIIAANISMFIAYKLRGKFGALIAILGIIFVPFLSIILLATILSNIASNRYIQGVFWGVGVAVIALIILTVREVWQNSKRDLYFYIMFLFALILLLIFKLSPIKTIIISTFCGLIYKIKNRKGVE